MVPFRGWVWVGRGWFDSGFEALAGISEGIDVTIRREIPKDDLKCRAWVVISVFI